MTLSPFQIESRNRLLPVQGAAVLVLDDPCFKEVLFLLEVHCLGHPWEWILRFSKDRLESELSAPAVRNEVHVLLAQACTQAEKSVGHRIASVGGLEFGCRSQHSAHLVLEILAPEVWVLDLDLVDHIDAEVEVD